MYRFVVIGAMPTPSKKNKKRDPSYRRVGSSRYPVERTQTYTVGAGSTILIDVAKTLSAQNHRLYRQGRLYHVRISLTDAAPVAADLRHQQFILHAIPDTWYVKKAWELAFATREEQLAETDHPRGRWDDFRVGWSSAYQTGTLGLAGDGASLVADEAQLAKVHDATDSADHGFVMFGAARDTANNLYGMIEQYDFTGNTVFDPGASSNSAYANTKDDAGKVTAAAGLKSFQGDNAPYDMDSFNGADDGGAVALPMLSSTTTGSGRTSVSCMLPLGLLKVTNATIAGGSGVTGSIQVTVSPGNYKGVKALEW